MESVGCLCLFSNDVDCSPRRKIGRSIIFVSFVKLLITPKNPNPYEINCIDLVHVISLYISLRTKTMRHSRVNSLRRRLPQIPSRLFKICGIFPVFSIIISFLIYCWMNTVFLMASVLRPIKAIQAFCQVHLMNLSSI